MGVYAEHGWLKIKNPNYSQSEAGTRCSRRSGTLAQTANLLSGQVSIKTFEVSTQPLTLTQDQDYLDAACEAVCPLQPACGHLQAMSGVFSIASHSVLQYFPEVALQEQTGWAHFLLSAIESPFTLVWAGWGALVRATLTDHL